MLRIEVVLSKCHRLVSAAVLTLSGLGKEVIYSENLLNSEFRNLLHYGLSDHITSNQHFHWLPPTSNIWKSRVVLKEALRKIEFNSISGTSINLVFTSFARYTSRLYCDKIAKVGNVYMLSAYLSKCSWNDLEYVRRQLKLSMQGVSSVTLRVILNSH